MGGIVIVQGTCIRQMPALQSPSAHHWESQSTIASIHWMPKPWSPWWMDGPWRESHCPEHLPSPALCEGSSNPARPQHCCSWFSISWIWFLEWSNLLVGCWDDDAISNISSCCAQLQLLFNQGVGSGPCVPVRSCGWLIYDVLLLP